MRKAEYYFLLLLMLFTGRVQSQDFHVSQYDAVNLYMNPALTGVYFKPKIEYSVATAYRSQWKSISGKSFSTFIISFDKSFRRFGLGGIVVNNRSASGGFNNFMGLLSGSYQIMNDRRGPHSLTVGVQAGFLNKSFNPDKFTFDSQYSSGTAGGFDNNLPSQEQFDRTSIFKIDAHMGIFYKYIENSSLIHPFAGISVFHVTMPDESFTESESRLPIRVNGNAGVDFIVGDLVTLKTSALYMIQGTATEINGGVLVYYNISESDYDVIGGIHYRWKDAIIAQAGLRFQNHTFRMSYDINTSFLSQYSGKKGGVEFTLVMTGKKKTPFFGF